VPSIRKVAWLDVADRRLLCVRTRGRTPFYVPGGKPEPGEDDQAALCREIAEELGIAIDRATIRPAGTFSAPADGQPDRMVEVTAFYTKAAGEPRPCAEIDALRRIDSSDPTPVSAVTRIILDQLKAAHVID
jgi:8-oxo-dGTP diphosphatase